MAESRSHALSLTEWSLGLAELPWDHPTSEDPVYEEWRNKDYSRPLFQRLDTVALSLLRKILSPAVSKRATIAQIRQHLWCRKSFKDKGEAAIFKGYFKLMILFSFYHLCCLVVLLPILREGEGRRRKLCSLVPSGTIVTLAIGCGIGFDAASSSPSILPRVQFVPRAKSATRRQT